MKQRWLFLIVVMYLAMIPAALCAQDSLIRDTAVLDKALIPALFVTGQGKVETSQLSMKFLKEGWAQYKGMYLGAQPKDAQWKKDLDKVEDHIRNADRIVAGGAGLSNAHNELEGARIILMKARQRSKIEYFPDYLTEFHEHMEEIFDAANKKTPETLSDKDMETIRKALPQAVAIWSTAKKARFDAELYGFSQEQVKKMNTLHQAEEEALAALQEALKTGARGEIIKHATSLKGKFVPVYLLFGDFERLKK